MRNSTDVLCAALMVTALSGCPSADPGEAWGSALLEDVDLVVTLASALVDPDTEVGVWLVQARRVVGAARAAGSWEGLLDDLRGLGPGARLALLALGYTEPEIEARLQVWASIVRRLEARGSGDV